MAVLQIRKFPDKVLRNKCKPVEKITPEIVKLVNDMFETMYANKGVGLAAPQVGVSKRIIIGNPTEKKTDEFVIINPYLVKTIGKRVKECEGCLSLPGINSNVLRYFGIIVTGKNLNDKNIKIEATGLTARIILHEIDHLDGILFIDRIGFFKRQRLIRKYKKICQKNCTVML